MGLRALVNNAVAKAFRSVGDLALDATLHQKDASSFDFSTLAVNTTAETTKTVKIVVLSTERKDSSRSPVPISNSAFMVVLMKTTDLSNPDAYDRLTVSGVTWKMVPPYVNNGYTIEVTLSREQ